MNIKEFALLVDEMRLAQKNYFRTRDPYWITQSKNLEKQVDDATIRILDPKPEQGTLGL